MSNLFLDARFLEKEAHAQQAEQRTVIKTATQFSE